MATRKTMNVSLTPELFAFVESRVASGRYQSDSEVVRQGLRLLEAQELELAEVRKQIARGVGQADRGELLDGQAVLAKLKKRSEARRRKHG